MTISSENKPEGTLAQDKVDSAAPVQDKKIDSSQSQPAQDKAPEEAKEDPNWRAFREARKKDRAEKEAAERKAVEKEAEVAALKAAMEAAFSKGQLPAVPSPSYEYQQEETEDERIEKKVQAALAAREAIADRARAEREQQEYPQRLQQIYSDFNQVISSENLDYLEYHYPEIAGPLKRHSDGFDKWSDIYKAVKRFVPNLEGSKKDAAKAEANFAKPKSMSATGMTQMGEPSPNNLSEDRKRANWERMQKMLKSVG